MAIGRGSALAAVAAILWGSLALADIFAVQNPDGSVTFTDAPVTQHYKIVIREAPPAPRARGWRTVAHREALKRRLDPLLVKAVIYVESGENPNAVSPKGAAGLMQLMPGTANALGVQDPLKPRDNIRGGVHYLADLIDRFGGRLDLALAAYNAGPAAVERYQGVPPYPETRAYVTKVLSVYRRLSARGGEDVPVSAKLD